MGTAYWLASAIADARSGRRCCWRSRLEDHKAPVHRGRCQRAHCYWTGSKDTRDRPLRKGSRREMRTPSFISISQAVECCKGIQNFFTTSSSSSSTVNTLPRVDIKFTGSWALTQQCTAQRGLWGPRCSAIGEAITCGVPRRVAPLPTTAL